MPALLLNQDPIRGQAPPDLPISATMSDRLPTLSIYQPPVPARGLPRAGRLLLRQAKIQETQMVCFCTAFVTPCEFYPMITCIYGCSIQPPGADSELATYWMRYASLAMQMVHHFFRKSGTLVHPTAPLFPSIKRTGVLFLAGV